MQKSYLRKFYKNKRANLTEEYRFHAERRIVNKLIAFFKDKPQSIIASFSPINTEIRLTEFNKYVAASKHQLVLPRAKKIGMVFTESTDGITSSMGMHIIPEFCIMPCICYNSLNYRIGYGLGYYDRYLAKNPEIFKIIANFAELRLSEEATFDEWDIPADLLIDESRPLDTARNP